MREGCCPAENSGIMSSNEEGNGVDLLCQLCDDAIGARRRSVHLPQRDAEICVLQSLMCYSISVFFFSIIFVHEFVLYLYLSLSDDAAQISGHFYCTQRSLG